MKNVNKDAVENDKTVITRFKKYRICFHSTQDSWVRASILYFNLICNILESSKNITN